MNKCRIILLWAVMTLVASGCAVIQPRASKTTDLWQSWDEVKKMSAINPRPILIDIYTDWCIYCKKMDATTYRNDSVRQYMQEHFYRIKFNAESKDTIYWQDKAFTFNPRYDVHDFAVYLTRGSIAYPTTVIITPGGQPFYQHGELKPGELELLLKYYSIASRKETIEQFASSFTSSWK